MQHLLGFGRRTASTVATLLLVAITLGCAAYILPSFFGYERYVITGGSMSGSIEKGSVVFERAVPAEELAVGDVITYLPPADSGVGTLVTHRITEIRTAEDGSRVFRTQGDANPHPDPWTFSLVSDTQPVVEYTVPYVGYAFIALADPQVRMLVIGLPAALIALIALRDLVTALLPTRPRGAGTRAPLTAGTRGLHAPAQPTTAGEPAYGEHEAPHAA